MSLAARRPAGLACLAVLYCCGVSACAPPPNSADGLVAAAEAIQANDAGAVRQWLRSGGNPNASGGGEGCVTLLSIAAKADADGAAAELLAAGANVNLKSGSVVIREDLVLPTPVICAARYNAPKVIPIFAAAGATLDSSVNDLNALALAVRSQSRDAVTALLKAGAKAEGTGVFSPVYEAVKLGDSNLLAQLEAAGARVTSYDRDMLRKAQNGSSEPARRVAPITVGMTWDEALPVLERATRVKLDRIDSDTFIDVRESADGIVAYRFHRSDGPYRVVDIDQ